MSWFSSLAPLPPDPVFGLSVSFKADPRTKKLNLSVGAYRDAYLRPFVFQSVRKAEEKLVGREEDKEYLPMSGDPAFLESVGRLAFGEALWGAHHTRVAAMQTVGGTNALRIGAELLRGVVEGKLFLPQPTWANHRHMMMHAGWAVDHYPYYDLASRKINMEKLLHFCETLPAGSVLLLHLSCHNPTGCDFTKEEWKALAHIMRKKKLIPFFDCAYQGLGDGLEEDTQALKIFIEEGMEFLLAYSCSKNFTLYCERVGALFVMTQGQQLATTLLTVLRMTTRALFSNPPAHGARVVATILRDPALAAPWREELSQIRRRISGLRKGLVAKLGPDYAFIEKCKGFFCITGLSSGQVEILREKYGIFMTFDGRINLAGLNEEAIDWLAQAMQEV